MVLSELKTTDFQINLEVKFNFHHKGETMSKTLAFLKDTWGIILSLCIMAILVFYAYGCEPTTRSIVTPTKKVNAMELQSEIDYLMAISEVRFSELEKKAQFRDAVFNQTIKIVETGNVTPMGLITSLAAVLGLGMGADDVRLRKERKKSARTIVSPKITEET